MKSSQKKSGWVLMSVLAAVPLLMVLGNSVLIPVMPTMQSKLHVSKFQISLLITLFSVPAGIVIPFAGYISDRMSRKWVIIPSLILFGIGGVLAGVSAWWFPHPYITILCGRVLQGIGAAGTAPIAMALVGDLFKGAQRSQALGVNEAGNAFGKVVSPIIGSLVGLLAWFAVFFIFPILCIPMALGVWFFIPKLQKAGQQQSAGEYLKSLGKVLRREGRWLFVTYLCGASALFVLFGILFYLSDLLETKYHIDGLKKGFVLAIPLLMLSVTSFITGALIKKQKLLMKWLMVIGFTGMAVVLLLAVWLTDNAWILVGLMSLSAVGTGITLPCLNTLITSAVNKEQRGIVTSLYGSVRFLGVAFGPPVFTWLLTYSAKIMFLSVMGLSILCALLILFMVKPSPQKNNEEKNERSIHALGRHKARI